MLWLVLWSFVVTLTPLVLGLVWKLTSAIGRRIRLGLMRAVASGNRSKVLPPLGFVPRPSPISVTGSSLCLRGRGTWAPQRRGSSRI